MVNEFSVVEYSELIGTQNLIVRCPKYLEREALALLKKVSLLSEQGKPLQQGVTIQVGWSILTVQEHEKGLSLCEPSFSTNPFVDEPFSEVTRTLLVIRWQQEFLMKMNFSYKENITLFNKKVLVEEAAIDAKEVSLERTEPAFADDSGWYLGLPSGIGGSESQQKFIYVYEFLQLRPGILSVLNLPVGYIIGFTGQDVEIVFDAVGTIVWKNHD